MAQTRLKYDSSIMNTQSIMSEQPQKYVTDAMIAERQMKFVHPEDVDTNTKLRPALTNKNVYNRPATELYGTAPYRGSGISGNLVNIESSLLQGNKNTLCDKVKTEKMFNTTDYMKIPLVVDSDLRSRSTRADLKNAYQCKKINN